MNSWFRLVAFLSVGAFALQARGSANPSPYLDLSLALETRVQDLISQLTLEEKATLLNHHGPDVARFHIRSDQWNQCLHGVSWDRPTTLFPIPTALAATWNPKLVHDVADAISDEARAIYNGWNDDPNFQGEKKGLIYRAPVINILRNPYWGRTSEAWSEDPFLCGRMAVAFVQGMQGNDSKYLKIAATLKHFAVNNVEHGRTGLDATVSERTLHEYWLPHFREAVIEGKACSVMASYNAINGVANNMNKMLLTDILKTEWGFTGFVVSDLGGVKTMMNGHLGQKVSYVDAVAESLMAGCDFSDKEYMTNIPAAVRTGKLTEERLNDALSRVLRIRFALGEFDPPDQVPYRKVPLSVICSAAHRNLSLQASREAIVLLQNNGNLLPLDEKKIKKIAVIGPLAAHFVPGDSNYIGKASRRLVTVLQGIQKRVGNEIAVTYAMGAEVEPAKSVKDGPDNAVFDTVTERKKAAALAREADVAIVCVGTTLGIEREGHDRARLGLPGNQQELVEAVYHANPRTIVLFLNAGPLTTPWIKENISALLSVWWSGEEQGTAIAEALFGDTNPGGHLPYTVYASEAQVPPQDEYDVRKGFTYMYLKGAPQFPFGHGLSYTTFGYGKLRLTRRHLAPSGSVNVSVEVENKGARAGDEVAQLYVHEVNSRVTRPAKQLLGFQRIHLEPGQKQEVSFNLRAEKLAYYDIKTHAFRVEPGTVEILVGNSSEDIRVGDTIEILADP